METTPEKTAAYISQRQHWLSRKMTYDERFLVAVVFNGKLVIH